jgi:hypothetical protein
MKNSTLIWPLFLLILACEKALPPVHELLKEANSADWSNAVNESVVISAPVSEVWTYASNSNNAKEWSIFFDHISPLPGIQDGQIGALRRCFRNANEQGPFWDEVVTEIVPEKLRQITTYNLTGFPMNFIVEGQYVFVRQLYRQIDEKTSELAFLTAPSPSASIFQKIAFYFSRSETQRIFKLNLENIKAQIERKARPHAWEK